MKAKILAMLRNANQYVSGQEMCNALGVSRTAVWKVMNQLKEEGYVIEAISNKGYSLVQSPDHVTDYEINSILGEDSFVKEVIYQEVMDSTNTVAKQIAMDKEEATLVITDCQEVGRGRRGRAWASKKGEGIFMTMILKPKIAPEHASMLTLVAALAVAKAIAKVTKLEASIKWPNDLVINKKKVCGILTEMSSEMDYIHYVIIGVGVNVNTRIFPEELKEMATSLELEGKESVKRAELVKEIVETFQYYYERFKQSENLAEFVKEYNQMLVHRNHRIKISNASSSFEGVAKGIDEVGSLQVELEDGSIKSIISGEVSVRGIYGYV